METPMMMTRLFASMIQRTDTFVFTPLENIHSQCGCFPPFFFLSFFFFFINRCAIHACETLLFLDFEKNVGMEFFYRLKVFFFF